MSAGFAIRLSDGLGLVTRWQDAPLDTYERAEECLAAMRAHNVGDGQIERLLLNVPQDTSEEGQTR